MWATLLFVFIMTGDAIIPATDRCRQYNTTCDLCADYIGCYWWYVVVSTSPSHRGLTESANCVQWSGEGGKTAYIYLQCVNEPINGSHKTQPDGTAQVRGFFCRFVFLLSLKWGRVFSVASAWRTS